MGASSGRVFISHLAGVAVFDPNGDHVGRLRDVVVMLRTAQLPRACSAWSSRWPPVGGSSSR